MNDINNLPTAITMGDPAGVGAEITGAAWEKRNAETLHPFFLIDNIDRLQKILPDIKFQEITQPSAAIEVFSDALPVFNIGLAAQPVLGELNPANGKAVINSIEQAVKFVQAGKANALVTNPIHKAALYNVGFEFAGHTEYLGALCADETGDKTSVMMLTTDELRVVPLTVHIPLKDVPDALTQDLIIEKTKIVYEDMKQKMGFQNPRIAISGLNPHAGEDGKMGREEIDTITPAIEKLKADGINVRGPSPADTLFHAEARNQYDVAICTYHDQALIPLKTLDFHGGVNLTLGLPIIRSSPDHGTALDIAGKGIANPSSLIAAIKMAQTIAKNRA